MKKILTLLIALLFIPITTNAQQNVLQGGTGQTAIGQGRFVVGDTQFKLLVIPSADMFWSPSPAILRLGQGVKLGFNAASSANIVYDGSGLVATTPDSIQLVTSGGPYSLTLHPSEGLFIPNNQSYQVTDTGGNKRSIGTVNASNELLLGDAAMATTRIPVLSTNGFVKTSGANGTLSVDTNTYPPAPAADSINTVLTWNGSIFTATGTPLMYAGGYVATSSAQTSTFQDVTIASSRILKFNAFSASPQIYGDGDTDSGIGFVSDGNLSLYSNGNTVLNVNNQQLVGIGTTAQGGKLHIVGPNAVISANAMPSFISAGGSGRTTGSLGGKGGSGGDRYGGVGGTPLSGTGGPGGDTNDYGGTTGDFPGTNRAGSNNQFAGYVAGFVEANAGFNNFIGGGSDIARFYTVPAAGSPPTITGNPAVTISKDGYIAHGTSTPYARLSIGSHNGATTIPSIVVASSSGSSATSTQLIFTGLGSLGIGTSSPYAKLAVVGEAVASNFTATSTTAKSTFTYASTTALSTSGRLYSGDNFYVGSSGSTGKTISMFASGGTEVTASADTYFGFPVFSTTMLKMTQGRLLLDPLDSKAEFVVSGANTQFNIYNSTLAGYYLRVSSDGSAVSTTELFGNVGMGTSSPWRKLSVTGTVGFDGLTTAAGTPSSVCMNATTKEITVNAALTCTVSARDQKQNIKPLEISGLTTILKLNPVSFEYKDQPNRERWGFIADEMQGVNHALGDGYNTPGRDPNEARTVDIPATTAALVKAMQEQQAQIEALKAEIKSLKKITW